MAFPLLGARTPKGAKPARPLIIIAPPAWIMKSEQQENRSARQPARRVRLAHPGRLALRVVGMLLASSLVLGAASPAPRRPRLVMVILADTLRADRMSAYGYPRSTTPALERIWARGATLFTQSYAAAAYTQVSKSSLLTGVRPSVHRLFGYKVDSWPAVPMSVQAYYRSKGFFAISANANPNTPWFHAAYDVVWSEQPPGRYHPAARVVAEARKLLAKAGPDRDVYLFMQFADTHLPYDPPVYDRSLFKGDRIGRHFAPRFDGFRSDTAGAATPAQRRNMENRYDASLRYLDSQLAPFIEEMQKRYPEHMIVFTGDHGEGFLEHGEIGHGSAMYDTVLRVPLVVIDSERPKRTRARSDALVTGLDLLPTLMERAGDGAVARAYGGRSFLWALTTTQPRKEPRLAMSESPYYDDGRTGFGGCWGLAYFYQPHWGDSTGSVVKLTTTGPRCGQLQQSVIHREQWFSGADLTQSRRLRPREAGASQLDPLFASAWPLPQSVEVKTIPLTPEEMQQLKALGYLNTGRQPN
ncbi:MAG: sulfatase [Acidobacteriota bacterium]